MPTIYTLCCENNKWYVGKTNRVEPKDRILEHFHNQGSEWTRKHKPLNVDKIFYDCDHFDEDKYTKIYMSKHGIENVRGGSYSQINLSFHQIILLQTELLSSKDACFQCGKTTHYYKQCPEKIKQLKNKYCTRCFRNNHTIENCFAKTDIYNNTLKDKPEKQLKPMKVRFNHDTTCFCCGTDRGFAIYNTDPIHIRYMRYLGHCSIVELLLRSNLVAIVMDSDSRTLVIWDDYKQSIIGKLEFSSLIKNVFLTPNHLIVVLSEKTIIYLLRSLTVLKVYQTEKNINGCFAVSENNGIEIFIVAGEERSNDFQIVHYNENQKTIDIKDAHNNAIQCLCLNKNGTLVASASERGTIVRIFNTKTGKLIKEFKRGIDPTSIVSMRFNNDSTLLAVSSDKGTIHIFSLVLGNKEIKEPSGFFDRWISWLTPDPSRAIADRSVSKIYLPGGNHWQMCFLTDDPTILIIIGKGEYYKYRFDTITGDSILLSNVSFSV